MVDLRVLKAAVPMVVEKVGDLEALSVEKKAVQKGSQLVVSTVEKMDAMLAVQLVAKMAGK